MCACLACKPEQEGEAQGQICALGSVQLMKPFDQLASNQHHHSRMNALYSPTQPCSSSHCIWLQVSMIQAFHQALQIKTFLEFCSWI